MATMGNQRRHDADNWTGYESGWVAGKTWAQPAPRRVRTVSRVKSLLLTLIIKIAGH